MLLDVFTYALYTATVIFMFYPPGHLMFVSPIQIAPLHLAAERGHDGIVELLLKNDASAETEDAKKVWSQWDSLWLCM